MFTDEEITDLLFQACKKLAIRDGEELTFEEFMREGEEEPDGFAVITSIIKEVLRLAIFVPDNL